MCVDKLQLITICHHLTDDKYLVSCSITVTRYQNPCTTDSTVQLLFSFNVPLLSETHLTTCQWARSSDSHVLNFTVLMFTSLHRTWNKLLTTQANWASYPQWNGTWVAACLVWVSTHWQLTGVPICLHTALQLPLSITACKMQWMARVMYN